MKKRFYLCLLAIAGMLQVTSCLNEKYEMVSSEDAPQVTFSLGVKGGLATRAISDGSGINKLVFAVYNDEGVQILEPAAQEVAFVEGAVETAPIALVKGQTYTAVFWAQNAACEAFNTDDLSAVTVDYTKMAANGDQGDAFFGAQTFTVTGSNKVEVELGRPFAQINVGTPAESWTAAVNAGLTVVESKAVVKQAASKINLLTGVVSEPVDVEYEFTAIPEDVLAVDTDADQVAEEYAYLAMCYVLVNDGTETGAAKAVLDELTFTFKAEDGTEIEFGEGLNNVPVQRNWRTNIVGNVLTGNVNFDVSLDTEFDGEENVDPDMVQIADGVYYKEKTQSFHVTKEVGLEWISENATENNGFEGATVVLAEDMDLTKLVSVEDENGEMVEVPTTTPPIGSTGERDGRNRLICEAFKGTFDGNGKTIKGLYQSGWDMGYEWGQYGSIGLFSSLEDATVKNLKIEGMEAQVEGGDIAFIAGSATGTCVFENIEITNSKIGTYNNGIGSIIGWSGMGNYTFKNIKIGSDVVLGGLWGSFDSSVGGLVGQGEPGATYHFEDVEISCRLDIYNDVTASYQYYLYRMCGMIIGRLQKTASIDGANYPDMSQYNITCQNVTVNYGDWMNYHYCYGFNGGRYTRVESGYAYGGLDITAEGHDEACTDHMLCLPFDGLFGGDQYGVRPIREYEGVTVNYPASYNPDAE